MSWQAALRSVAISGLGKKNTLAANETKGVQCVKL
jgi:hypothetical protein